MDSTKTNQQIVYKRNTCIVGIGNTLRSDDGVGAYTCQLLKEKNLPAVIIITTQQLDISMAEELSKFDSVIFIDASLQEETISFQSLLVKDNPPQSFSHHINAAMLVSLARQLFLTDTRFYICAIGAHNFEMGTRLSEKTIHNAAEAASLLAEWIQHNG